MKMMEDERSDLRKELQFLKDCQFKYFSLSITASGVIIGVGMKLSTSGDLHTSMLSPLLVILPCWIIFFDKATTITRIVGYLTILETFIVEKNLGITKFVGWENAIFLFREKANTAARLPRLGAHVLGIIRGLRRLMLFRSAHRYWVFCWLTFFGLGAVSLWLSSEADYSGYHWRIAVLAFGLTSIQTLGVLGNLIDGMYSYAMTRQKWLEVLSTSGAQHSVALAGQKPIVGVQGDSETEHK